MARENRAEVLRAIADHLATQGPVGWEAVQARFSDVPQTTFWRWVREVKASPPPPKLLEAACERLHRISCIRPPPAASGERPPPSADTPNPGRYIPVPPATVARNGDMAVAGMNFLAELDGLLNDAKALRDWSVRCEGGMERVVNPRMLDRAIGRRLELLTTTMAVTKDLWDLRRMEAFYSSIVEEVAAEAPDCARRIQQRLADLDAKMGMTCSTGA